MARLGVVVASSVVVGCLLTAVGCGSSGDSTFGSNGGASGGNGNDLTSGSLGSSGGGASGASGGTSGTSGTSGGVGTVVDPTAACATSNAGVDSLPIYLVFMIDHSGSMDVPERWAPVQTGLNTFFADPANSNVHAAMAFFSQGADQKPTDPGCQASTYQAEYGTATGVPMTALPNGAPFAAAFTAIGKPAAETPTLPAEQGAIAYAQTIKAGLKPGEQVAIVLATDGQPNNCSSTVSAVTAAAAAGAAAGIKTYVVGVGPSTGNLDAIAVGGGTGPSAILINTTSPAQVSADLGKAIGKIKASQLSCNYALPPPPAGQTLDVNAVNVNFTPGGGAAQTLPYSANCTDPNGWHYDNTTAPTQIIMCPSRCTALQGDTTGGKLDIIFGCAITAPPGTQLPGGGVK